MARMSSVVPILTILLCGLLGGRQSEGAVVSLPAVDVQRTIERHNGTQFDATQLKSVDCEWAERLLLDNPPGNSWQWVPTLKQWKQQLAGINWTPGLEQQQRSASWSAVIDIALNLDLQVWMDLHEQGQNALDVLADNWHAVQAIHDVQLTNCLPSVKLLPTLANVWQSITKWESGDRFADLDLKSNTVLVMFPAVQIAEPVATLTDQQAIIDYWEYYETCDYWGADFATACEAVSQAVKPGRLVSVGSDSTNQIKSHLKITNPPVARPSLLPLLVNAGGWALRQLKLDTWSQEDWFNVLVPIQTVQR